MESMPYSEANLLNSGPAPMLAASATSAHPQVPLPHPLHPPLVLESNGDANIGSSYSPTASAANTTSPTQLMHTDANSLHSDTSSINNSSTSPGDPYANGVGDGRSPLGISFPAVPTACLACRGKHLKCDGQSPCSRCQQTETECVYIASRRGYKGPRKPAKRTRSSSPPPLPQQLPSSAGISHQPPESCPMLLGAPRTVPSVTAPTPMSVVTSSYAPPLVASNAHSNSSTANMATAYGAAPCAPPTDSVAAAAAAAVAAAAAAAAYGNASVVVGLANGSTAPAPLVSAPAASINDVHLYRNPYAHGMYGVGMGDGSNMALAVAPPPQPSLADRCLDAYYHYFFTGHPFLLPKELLLSLAKDASVNISHLLAAMRYIGSLYIDAGPARATYFDEAVRLAYLPTCPKDGFLVQTLILLIVGQDGSCNQERARQFLADCERIALEIGLNERNFAAAHGRGNPVIEESWRRTWWDLFVVDGMVAGVHRMTNFLLFDVNADVALPCEEAQYLSGDIPPPAYIEEFDDQLFNETEREFSSFSYRVAAARILGRFMRCPPILFPNDENLEKIESLLSNWRIHLPASKQDDLTKNCQLDEMMFQAHFITHACSILLHQPHSQLDSSPTRSVTSCAPHSVVPSGDSFNTHTRHTITAACEISKMVTQAVPLLSHTHFFTCVITLSSIVHLSKWALYFIQDEEDLRQQIRLNIGALNKLSEVWKAANTASGQVRGVAQEIYRAKKAQQVNPAFWVGFTQEEMINSINTDEGIMSEFDTMLPVTSAVGTTAATHQ